MSAKNIVRAAVAVVACLTMSATNGLALAGNCSHGHVPPEARYAYKSASYGARPYAPPAPQYHQPPRYTPPKYLPPPAPKYHTGYRGGYGY